MSLVFCDGFDHYVNPGDKWDTVTGVSPYLEISSAAARTAGGQGLVFAPAEYQTFPSVSKAFASSSTLTVGFAFYISAAPGSPLPLLSFVDNVTTQITFVLLPSGLVGAFTGAASTGQGYIQNNMVAQSTVAVPMSSVWSYLEFQVTFANTAVGSVTVKLNGQTVLSASNIVTAASANNSANTLVLGYMLSLLTPLNAYYVDDLYLCDSSGTANTGFLSDVHVVALLPTGAGESTQWTPNGAAANWECVDDNPPNDGTTYISSATVGAKDMYTLQSLPNPGTIHAVQVLTYASKDQAGGRTLQHVVRDTVSGNEISGSQLGPGTTYHFLASQFDTDPSGNSWTYTEIDQMQAGVEVAS